MKAANGENIDIENDYIFLMLCNNITVDILKYADKYNWSSEKIDIKEKDKDKFNSSKYDLFYFREHGYAKTINKSLYKHIVFSLVADYIRYIYDAIDCASRYHFGTAFTLLRKPLKDDLLLIEMIYAKGYYFIPKFLNQSIDHFAIDRTSKEEKMKILKKCCKKINLFSAEMLYDWRYSKKSRVSLERIWNKTSHIITTANEYATENGNLNIIFATKDTVEENLVYFYKTLVHIQLYFITLLLNILKDENLISEKSYNKNITNLYLACFCTLGEDIPKDVIKDLVIKCEYCDSVIQIENNIIKSNCNNKTFELKCEKCKNINRIKEFIL